MIDIVIVATLRPELLNNTLKSFWDNLFKAFPRNNYRAIVNVDPIGLVVPSEEVLDTIATYFNITDYNLPKEPHFGRAVHWCWSQVSSELVFNLEEDWELLRPINFRQMVECMEKNPTLAHLRLSTWRSEDKLKQWKWFLDYENGYFVVPDNVKGTIGFCGHPSINKREFIKTCVDHMNPEANPEKQIKWRNKELWEVLEWYRYGIFQGRNEPAAIRDTGRQWMIDNGFSKKGNKEWFTEWEVLNENN